MENNETFELKQLLSLYEFYISSYIKGLAFYITITGALIKFSLEAEVISNRIIFSIAGLTVNLISLCIIMFAFFHRKDMQSSFQKLSSQTGTSLVKTSPFNMLIYASLGLWLLTTIGWIHIIGDV